MMKIIDITGPIREGMWDFGFPGGQFKLKQLNYDFLGEEYFHEGFEGMVGSTGTFIETGATSLGYERTISTDKISLDKLVNVDAYVLQTPFDTLKEQDGRKYVSEEDIIGAEQESIPSGAAIIVSTGYGRRWFSSDYLEKSPFFKKDAVYYLLDKKPILLSSDFPAWENTVNPELFLERMYGSGVCVLVSCINVEKVKRFKVKLIALPIRVENVCMCPARAVLIEDD
jgi:kynurenine formamidase